MTSIMISKRLETIANYCPQGAKVADIGSDHALLAAFLLTSGTASYVIAGELNEGPFQAAKKQIDNLQLHQRATVRKGDGLAVLAPQEVDVICIAGMGGQLIASILEAGKDKLDGVSRLILQPNVGADTVRRWLIHNGWQLVAETIMEEDQIIYEILVAEPGDPLVPYTGQDRTVEELIRIGPFLWREHSAALRKKWQAEQQKLQYVAKQLQQSSREEAKLRLDEVNRELQWIEEVVQCLQTDKPSFNGSNS
ncbi:tRNA (adenine(22)-N(1))-methyltransferase [Brevibacillus fulvus]|uniref:tRNA (Adenine22-N1)-methyltransferase n=1 Tax=Brevibacillus fulvus TaxID=1125967 RepID=A0A938XX97_9BACL|nr:tRNA (adenine(22)-N(1))-methyltransferase TrmK [Brevibacillus fulvus]MBM7589839.1 tRNA (adenine22-N1)-methyltransferase [Brevibacillus fulvus]